MVNRRGRNVVTMSQIAEDGCGDSVAGRRISERTLTFLSLKNLSLFIMSINIIKYIFPLFHFYATACNFKNAGIA